MSIEDESLLNQFRVIEVYIFYYFISSRWSTVQNIFGYGSCVTLCPGLLKSWDFQYVKIALLFSMYVYVGTAGHPGGSKKLLERGWYNLGH